MAPLAPASAEDSANAPLPTPAISSIAVLPFIDMSPAHDQGYFCEGIAEELITALSQVAGFRVAARTASFHFRQTGGDVREIARHLHITDLLDGSVRKADERLRITVQLVDVASGYQHWSERFDRTTTDVFAIQDEIAEHVALRVRAVFSAAKSGSGWSGRRRAPPPTSITCAARQHLVQMTRSSLAQSVALFQQAIDRDPHYGPAFAGLATVARHVVRMVRRGGRDLQRRRREPSRARSGARPGRGAHGAGLRARVVAPICRGRARVRRRDRPQPAALRQLLLFRRARRSRPATSRARPSSFARRARFVRRTARARS